MSLDFLRLPMIGITGMLFYSEEFNINIFVGGALMVIGNLIANYQRKNKGDK